MQTATWATPEKKEKDAVHCAVERQLSEHFGHQVRCRHLGDYFKGKTRTRGIRYSVYRSSDGLDFFVKQAVRLRLNPSLETALSTIPDMTVPKFFGTGRIGGSTFAIWERHNAPMMAAFDTVATRDLLPVVDAMIALADATQWLKHEVEGLRCETLWVHPKSDELEKVLQHLWHQGDIDRDVLADLTAASKRFSALEKEILDRTNHLGCHFLAHNDLAGHNILQLDNGRLAFVDWELASVGAPGAALRGFTMLSAEVQWQLADYYSDRLNERGHDIDARDVYFVMGAMQTYFNLSTGVTGKKVAPLMAAFDNLPSLVESRL
jgi:hypothetical protein